MEARRGSDVELQAYSQHQQPGPQASQRDRAHLSSMEQNTKGDPEDQNRPLLSPAGELPACTRHNAVLGVWSFVFCTACTALPWPAITHASCAPAAWLMEAPQSSQNQLTSNSAPAPMHV